MKKECGDFNVVERKIIFLQMAYAFPRIFFFNSTFTKFPISIFTAKKLKFLMIFFYNVFLGFSNFCQFFNNIKILTFIHVLTNVNSSNVVK